MNLELAQQVVALLGEYPVSEIAVEAAGHRVHAVRPLGIAPSAPPSAAAALPAQPEASAAEVLPEPKILTAPMVGIFYHAEPPLPLGADVKLGQVVGSIESMKLMNDVVAEEGGRIADILVEDGAPVDYGRALFRLSAS